VRGLHLPGHARVALAGILDVVTVEPEFG
jgi:hypothetical protein